MDAFPPGFVWGTGTSAYQVEGGVDLDGRASSIWDTFSHTPKRIRDGSTGDVAVDHRNRWKDDVALLAELGVGGYRFSVAWPRVQPDGVSQGGLDFYRSLVDELLAHGIEPFVTLYHWDLPQRLEDAGGWPVRATAERFAEYAGIVAGALGDRVRRWGTVNEPWCAAMLGYAVGIHAPGRREPGAAVAAAHHLLLGHGLAVDAVRAAAAPDAEVSITLNPYPVVAAGDRDEDLDAARRVDGLANRLWYDAVLRGEYPADVLDDVSAVTDLSFVRDGDLAVISRPLDALGLNYYRRHHVRHAEAPSKVQLWPGSPHVELVDPPGAHTDLGWAIEPDGVTEVLLAVQAWDPPPLYVHENGAAFADVHDDERRVAFLADHVAAARVAMDRGVDLRGWFVWTLMDNFEWAEGFQAPFGLVHVDLDTLERTPRRSFDWYRRLVAGGGVLP